MGTVFWIALRLIAVFAVMVGALRFSMSLVGVRVRSPLSVAIAVGLFCSLFLAIPWIGWLLAGLFALRCIFKLTGAPLMPDALAVATISVFAAMLCKWLLF